MFDVDRLLNPTPLQMETGYERLDNGVLHVAVRTDMRGCTGEMFTWWFGSRPGGREYSWWHPIDHGASSWVEGHEGDCVGSIHKVTEKMTQLDEADLSVQFIDPKTLFTADPFQDAQSQGWVSAAVTGRTGDGHEAPRTPDGEIIGGRLIHLGRDTPWGMVLRSHFLVGYDLPEAGLSATEVQSATPDALGPNLLQHCYDEFTFLSRILPPLYEAENRARLDITRPW